MFSRRRDSARDAACGELQNQQPHLGEARPDDGMQRMRHQNDWGRCECRVRLEELMRGADVEAEIRARRDDKREQRAKVIAERNKVKAEAGSEPRTAPQNQPASSHSNGL